MAKLSDRNKMLEDMVVTEGMIRQLRALDYDEAAWRIEHEMKEHIKWAQQRAGFLMDEIKDLKPVKSKPKPVHTGPPIVRRASAGGTVHTHGYGERFG